MVKLEIFINTLSIWGFMRRRDSPQYQSLVQLMEGNTPARDMTPAARRAAYWDNTVQVEVKVKYRNGNFGTIKGSGVLLTEDGYFVTNEHVFPQGTKGETITLYDARNDTYSVFPIEKSLVRSKKMDLALAKADMGSSSKPTPVIFAQSQPVQNDQIRVYGFKHDVPEELSGVMVKGGDLEYTQTLAHLIVPGRMQTVRDRFYESTCGKVEPGWSGGPVVDTNSGKLIGLTYARAERDEISTLLHGQGSNHFFVSVKALRQGITHFLNNHEK